MAKVIAEYRTVGNATVHIKFGWTTGHTWECDGCGAVDQGGSNTFSSERNARTAANAHANSCRAIRRVSGEPGWAPRVP